MVWFPVDGFNLHRKFKLLQGYQMCQSFAPCLPCSCFNIAAKQQYWESGVCSVERLSPCVMFPARKAFKYLICSLPVSQSVSSIPFHTLAYLVMTRQLFPLAYNIFGQRKFPNGDWKEKGTRFAVFIQ